MTSFLCQKSPQYSAMGYKLGYKRIQIAVKTYTFTFFRCNETVIIPKRYSITSIDSILDLRLVKSATYQFVVAVGCLVLANWKLYHLRCLANQGGA